MGAKRVQGLPSAQTGGGKTLKMGVLSAWVQGGFPPRSPQIGFLHLICNAKELAGWKCLRWGDWWG